MAEEKAWYDYLGVLSPLLGYINPVLGILAAGVGTAGKFLDETSEKSKNEESSSFISGIDWTQRRNPITGEITSGTTALPERTSPTTLLINKPPERETYDMLKRAVPKEKTAQTTDTDEKKAQTLAILENERLKRRGHAVSRQSTMLTRRSTLGKPVINRKSLLGG